MVSDAATPLDLPGLLAQLKAEYEERLARLASDRDAVVRVMHLCRAAAVPAGIPRTRGNHQVVESRVWVVPDLIAW
jgi:hypothetical protein